MERKIGSFDPRQEMSSEGFEIQHKLDAGLRHVELHHHDFYEIYYLVSGNVTYLIEGRFYRVMPGDLLLVSPRELHQVSIREDGTPYERYVLWLRPGEVQRLSAPACALERGLDPRTPGYTNTIRLRAEEQNTVRRLMENIYQESGSGEYGAELLRECCLKELLVRINRFSTQREREKLPEGNNRLILDVLEYVNLHYGEKLTLDGLAERFFVSKYHLSHEFRKHLGTGVYQYIRKKRLQLAKEFLAEGKNPGTVSTLVGFGDYAGFYRAFLGEYGITPREYAGREKNRET